jgi:hypothetical protein
MIRIFLFFALTATPLFAQNSPTPDASGPESMAPEAFENFSTGKTLYFSWNGQPYGVEQFFKGRRTIWRAEDGDCIDGRWYGRDRYICFIYDGSSEPQCWQFIKTAGGYSARAEGADPDLDIELQSIDTKDIICPAPALGV